MKKISLTSIAILTSLSQTAHAGFRHPIEQSGEHAQAIQSTPVFRSGSTRAPVAAPSAPSRAAPVASAPKVHPSALKSGTSIQSNVYGPQPSPGAQSTSRMPASLGNGPARSQSPNLPKWNAPVPQAPGLPTSPNVAVPNLNLPQSGTITITRDLSAPIQAPAKSRAQMHSFSRQARMIPLPTREYSDQPRSPEIVSKYSDALKPYPHKRIRTDLDLTIEKHSKIKNPPSGTHYENMVKRVDALFAGLDFHYARAAINLWELSESKSNPKKLQARDALFAAIISQRAGWDSAASNLYENSANKKVDAEERYLGILFSQLENFENPALIDRVVSKLNPMRVKAFSPEGDKANFALAKRALTGRGHPALSAENLESLIHSKALREKIAMMGSINELRNEKGDHETALAALREIETGGTEENREMARLALARALLKKGSTKDALDYYQNAKKDGRNRLEVMAEQSYAEYLSGKHQESLGKTMGLQSPYFQYGFSPDIHMIEIMNRKAMCDFGGAEKGLQRFAERYRSELVSLEELLARGLKPIDFYHELIAYHGSENPLRYQRYLLHLTTVLENQKTLNVGVDELDRISKVGLKRHTQERPAGWEKFEESMRVEWKGFASKVKVESAQVALAEAAYLAKRLRDTFAQAELLGLDVATSASKNFNIQSALNFPVRKLAQEEIARDKFHWPFEDEVWEDELDYLKMKNPSKCSAVTKVTSNNP